MIKCICVICTILTRRGSGTYDGSLQSTVNSPSPVIMLTKSIQTHFYLISQCPWFPFTFPTLAQEGPQGNMWAALVQHRMMTLRYNVCKAALAKSPWLLWGLALHTLLVGHRVKQLLHMCWNNSSLLLLRLVPVRSAFKTKIVAVTPCFS